MDEKLREVFKAEFERVYSQAWLDGFIQGALEGAKQAMAKENKDGRTTKPQWNA
jgi:hypothetical protein